MNINEQNFSLRALRAITCLSTQIFLATPLDRGGENVHVGDFMIARQGAG